MSYLGNLYNRMYRRVREEFFPPRHPFDQTNGVDTSGRLNLLRLAIDSPNRKYGRDYQGAEPGRFSDALREVRENFSGFTFVDLGAGKGRALMMAHQMGFRRLIGVEFSSKLAEIARANLAKLGLQHVQVFTQDAAEFRFPEEALVVFTNNSFGPEVFEGVLANLRKQTNPFYLVYMNPLHNSILRSAQFLNPVAANRFHAVWHFKPVGHAQNMGKQLEVSA